MIPRLAPMALLLLAGTSAPQDPQPERPTYPEFVNAVFASVAANDSAELDEALARAPYWGSRVVHDLLDQSALNDVEPASLHAARTIKPMPADLAQRVEEIEEGPPVEG